MMESTLSTIVFPSAPLLFHASMHMQYISLGIDQRLLRAAALADRLLLVQSLQQRLDQRCALLVAPPRGNGEERSGLGNFGVRQTAPLYAEDVVPVGMERVLVAFVGRLCKMPALGLAPATP